jgi:hypothetical protein
LIHRRSPRYSPARNIPGDLQKALVAERRNPLPFQHSKAAYTFREFLELVSLGKNSGLREIAEKRIAVKRVGVRRRKILITAEAIDDWLRSQQSNEVEIRKG